MDIVPGIPGYVPSLAAYPPSNVQSTLPPEEWQACLDAWIFSVECRLRLTAEHFNKLKLAEKSSGFPFLLSYLRLIAQTPKSYFSSPGSREARLRNHCFLLLRRLLIAKDPPLGCSPLDLFDVLANGSVVFSHSAVWTEIFKLVSNRSPRELGVAFEAAKMHLTRCVETLDSTGLRSELTLASSLVKSWPTFGVLLMTGSDYLEGLASCYVKQTQKPEAYSRQLQDALTEHTFILLKALMSTEMSSVSLLLDHLFLLKTNVEKAGPAAPSLLSSLVVRTSLVRQLDIYLSASQHKRGRPLLDWLRSYREQTSHLHPPAVRRRLPSKMKGKDKAYTQHEMHMHQVEKVSQVQELFPELSDGYIVKLLDHFVDNVEDVTAALLEPEALPAHLKNESPQLMDELKGHQKTSDVSKSLSSANILPVDSFVPRRKNVFDNDDFDLLRVPLDRMHIGQRDIKLENPTAGAHARSKAAIMSALTAFDADDDERDDTYDVADVGGTVDDTVDTDERPVSNEEILYGAWNTDMRLFARDSKTRLSQPRRQIKLQTGMTDEQIEGWALMLGRDDDLQAKLRQKYSAAAAFSGGQLNVASTKWRASPTGSEDDASSGIEASAPDSRRQGLAGIRGHRSFPRGSRGTGSTSGPAKAPSTQVARKRKEQGRGRGNHHHRDGRAKKIGRGMAEMP